MASETEAIVASETEAIVASATEANKAVADDDQSTITADSETSTVDCPESLSVTRTLIYEDGSGGVAALAAAVAAAPLLRRRVWLHDNGVGKEHLEAASRVLEGCGIEELCLIESHPSELMTASWFGSS